MSLPSQYINIMDEINDTFDGKNRNFFKKDTRRKVDGGEKDPSLEEFKIERKKKMIHLPKTWKSTFSSLTLKEETSEFWRILSQMPH